MLGNALTKLANVFEDIAVARAGAFIGGGGIDSLPAGRQQEISKKWPRWIAAIQKHPRHVVTRELVRSMQMSQRFNREARLHAQLELLEMLVAEGIAFDVEQFQASYVGNSST